jgi:hypothetical protein
MFLYQQKKCIHTSLFILKIEEVADIIQLDQFHQQQNTKKKARAYVL